jgi:hypothetical protein
MRCGAFHRVEGTLCLVRHGQAALSGSKTKAPGFAGGYLLKSRSSLPDSSRQSILFARRWLRGSIPGSSPGTRMTRRGLQEVSKVELLEVPIAGLKNLLTEGI